ncbi:MAG: hypothetical protein IKT46_00125 [Clostridia bacterium]|nr:hypothetical protein [Clostridia bacterium]
MKKYFGFFKGMKYGECDEDFEFYRSINNKYSKTDILTYMKSLSVSAIAMMSVEDIFDGERIEQAGIIEDGDFIFPCDFIHYFEKYDIGITLEYEGYIENYLNK